MAKAKKARLPDPDWEKAWTEAPGKQGGLILRAGSTAGRILGFVYDHLPEGMTLVLGPDLPRNTEVPVFKTRVPLLAESHIRYPGEPVGLVCGPNLTALQAWARSFRVVTGHRDAGPDRTENRSRSLSWGEEPAPEEGDWTFHRSYTAGTQTALDFSPLRVRILSKEAQTWLQAPTQWPRNLLDAAARVLDRPREELVLFPVPRSTPLDSRLWYPGWAAAAAALLHRASGRPVELEIPKEEEAGHLPRRPEAEMTFQALLSRDGRLKSLDVVLELHCGAQGILEGEILDRMIVGIGSLVKIPHWKVRASAVLTAGPPRGPLGTWGEETAQTALGIFLSDLCTRGDLDPDLWLPSILPGQGEKEGEGAAFFTGGTLKEPPPLTRLLAHTVGRTDFRRKYGAFAALGKKPADPAVRFRRGIGLAAGSSGTGFLASGTSPASMALEWTSPEELTILTTLALPRSPLARLWTAKAAAFLSLPEEGVRLRPWIPGNTPDGGPATLSRAAVLGGRLLTQCLEGLKEQADKKSPFPLLMEKTYRRPPSLNWNPESFSGIPFVAMTWGTAAAEVEWDMVFSRICLRKITLDIFCGPLEDPQAARSAVLASLRSALGWCLTEISGPPGSSSPRLLREEEMPEVDLAFHPGGPKSPSRGVGGIPWSIVPPAVLSAAAQATGAAVTHWPLTRQDFPEFVP